MTQRIETITSHIFAFDDEEILTIINALYATGNTDLADEIWEELHGGCDECDCE